jgi:two-component system response regulator PilR (NtrC family)
MERPRSNKAVATMDNVETASTGTGIGSSILVVDDETNFAALLETVLTDRGYEVQTALSGESALNLAGQGAFDLALLDIRLGQTTGLALLGELKQRLPKIKVIMITAYPTPDSYRQSVQKGASAFFAKPLDLQELVQTVRRLLS